MSNDRLPRPSPLVAMTTNRCSRLPVWTLLLLLLLPIVYGCSSRGAATYRQTGESLYTTAAAVADRGQASRWAAPRALGAEVRGQGVEPLPRAQARIGRPFLIPGDDEDGGDDGDGEHDVRPVSISDVEAVAAGFHMQEPSSYTGELESQVEQALYPPTGDALGSRRTIQDVMEVFGARRPFLPRCAHCLLRPHTVRPLTPAPPINYRSAREMARKQRQQTEHSEPYLYVIELVHNVTEENLPGLPPIRDEFGNLRQLVKEEDVLRKVDIRIEEGWDKEAFEHRGWKSWDWLREHHGAERDSHTDGNNQIRLGFEPTLGNMMEEMLRAGKATPDEIRAALEALVQKNQPLHVMNDAVKEKRNGEEDAGLVQHNIEDSGRGDFSKTGSDELNVRQKKKKQLPVRDRGAITWRHGRAPWAPTAANPWDRHGRLMSEFDNPEDTTPSSKASSQEIGGASRGTARAPRRRGKGNVDSGGWMAVEGEGERDPPEVTGPPRWFVEGRPLEGNEGRLRRFIEAKLGRKSRRNSGDWDPPHRKTPDKKLSSQMLSGRTPTHLTSLQRKLFNRKDNSLLRKSTQRSSPNRKLLARKSSIRKSTDYKSSKWRAGTSRTGSHSDAGSVPGRLNEPLARSDNSLAPVQTRTPQTQKHKTHARNGNAFNTGRPLTRQAERGRTRRIGRRKGGNIHQARRQLFPEERKRSSLALLLDRYKSLQTSNSSFASP